MANETEVRQMVTRIIDLGKLLAEVANKKTNEQQQSSNSGIDQTSQKAIGPKNPLGEKIVSK